FSAEDQLPAEPLIPGRHNRENAAAATAAARAAGVSDDAIAQALGTFPGVPHRLELVRELRGVRYVNDSKATNTAAARRAVAAYDAPLRLILGGSLKGEDFGPLARDLPPNVRSIYLIGAATDELALALDAAWRPYTREGDLEHAIAPTLVVTALALCLAVLAIGERINGARRWIGFGPAAFQPSELAKLALVVWAAAYLARKPPPRTLKDLARPIGALVGVFCLLIL